MLNLKKPTIGQLIYMKDLYDYDTLLMYLDWKYSKKFNNGSLTDEERKTMHEEMEILKINLFDFYAYMDGEYEGE